MKRWRDVARNRERYDKRMEMIPKEVAHGICLSQARSTGRKRRRRRRSVGSGLRGSSSSQSRAPWLSSTSSWRLNLSSASGHQGERKGLGKGSSTITDQNNTADRTFASLAEERVPRRLPTAQQIPQKCGHHSACAHKHLLHNRHTAMSASSSWIFIGLINTQVGNHSILHETPVTWRENESWGEEEMGHMVTVEEANGKRDRVRGKAFFPLPENFFIFFLSQEWGGGGGNVLYCSRSWYPPVAFPYEARLGQQRQQQGQHSGSIGWELQTILRCKSSSNESFKTAAISLLRNNC